MTRSTFSAELFAACDSIDHTLLIAQLLHDIWTPPSSSIGPRQLRENGGYAIPVVICIDAMSIWSAIAAIHIKTPAEKSLLGHLQFIKELLVRRVVHTLRWVDTRMMHSDGLTKGVVSRDDLQRVMQGILRYLYELRDYTPPASALGSDEPDRASRAAAAAAPSAAAAAPGAAAPRS